MSPLARLPNRLASRGRSRMESWPSPWTLAFSYWRLVCYSRPGPSLIGIGTRGA